MTTFTVFSNDFLNTGASYRSYHGVVIIPHEWKTENNKITRVNFNQLKEERL